jgi:hypothetical protein
VVTGHGVHPPDVRRHRERPPGARRAPVQVGDPPHLGQIGGVEDLIEGGAGAAQGDQVEPGGVVVRLLPLGKWAGVTSEIELNTTVEFGLIKPVSPVEFPVNVARI